MRNIIFNQVSGRRDATDSPQNSISGLAGSNTYYGLRRVVRRLAQDIGNGSRTLSPMRVVYGIK